MASFNLSRAPAGAHEEGHPPRRAEAACPAGYEVDLHFKPRYNPWEQRLCLVPDSDLFEAISRGRGLGRHRRDRDLHRDGHQARARATELEADVIVTATGLNVLLLGGVDVAVDGEPVDFSETVAYKGMMICGVPNFAHGARLHERVVDAQVRPDRRSTSAGSSTTWTRTATTIATPQPPDPSLPTEPFIDFNSGYVLRSHRQAAEAGRRAAVAPAPELVPRRAAAEARPGRTTRWSSRAGRRGVSRFGRRRRTARSTLVDHVALGPIGLDGHVRAVALGAARPRSTRGRPAGSGVKVVWTSLPVLTVEAHAHAA